MSFNIAIGCNFYNDYAGLKRLIDSIPKGFIDQFIGIDGIYKYNKEKNPDLFDVSDDGSREFLVFDAKEKIKHVILIDKYNKTEFEKRNAYLEICDLQQHPRIDVLLIVDTDEFFIYPEGTKPEDAFFKFRQNIERTVTDSRYKDHNVFSMHTLDVANNYNIHRPRIWYKPGEMRYINGSHYHYANITREKDTIELFNKQGINYCQHTEMVIKGVVLAHDHSLRTQKQMELRRQYIDYLRNFEGLTQSHYFTIDQAHNLAVLGVSRDQVNMNNKDDIIKKYLG